VAVPLFIEPLLPSHTSRTILFFHLLFIASCSALAIYLYEVLTGFRDRDRHGILGWTCIGSGVAVIISGVLMHYLVYGF
jgi:hypothetical protein